jgi:hypothetical protein
MRRENFLINLRMLEMQLNEEQENYNEVLKGKRRSAELEYINQRISALQALLHSIEKSSFILNNPKVANAELF